MRTRSLLNPVSGAPHRFAGTDPTGRYADHRRDAHHQPRARPAHSREQLPERPRWHRQKWMDEIGAMSAMRTARVTGVTARCPASILSARFPSATPPHRLLRPPRAEPAAGRQDDVEETAHGERRGDQRVREQPALSASEPDAVSRSRRDEAGHQRGGRSRRPRTRGGKSPRGRGLSAVK